MDPQCTPNGVVKNPPSGSQGAGALGSAYRSLIALTRHCNLRAHALNTPGSRCELFSRYNGKVIAVEPPKDDGDDETYFVKYADGSKISGVPRSSLRPRTSRKHK